MKRVLLICWLYLLTFFCFSQVNPNNNWVNGYFKSNGTYVNGHYRTNPNKTNRDNYSTYPNVNPYTGKIGTVTPDNNGFASYTPIVGGGGMGYKDLFLLGFVGLFTDDPSLQDLGVIVGAAGLFFISDCVYFYPSYNFNSVHDFDKIRYMFGYRISLNHSAIELGLSYINTNTTIISEGLMDSFIEDPGWGFHMNYVYFLSKHYQYKKVNLYIGPTVNYIGKIGVGGLVGSEIKITNWLKFDLRYELTTRTNQLQAGLVFKYGNILQSVRQFL